MSLDTLSNVKARLGITTSADDTLLGLLQDTADAAIANYCNRDFAGGTFTEYAPGGSEFIHLRNFPVSSVTSVKLDSTRNFGAETVVSTDDYVVETDRGVIQSVAGAFLPSEPQVLQVVYATATSSVPADVKEAYARLVGHGYRRVKTDVAANFQNVIQQKFGETFVVFSGAEGGLPDDVTALLAPYRTPLL
jgi:uncharacterized phiE125 gp8 family phage protein